MDEFADPLDATAKRFSPITLNETPTPPTPPGPDPAPTFNDPPGPPAPPPPVPPRYPPLTAAVLKVPDAFPKPEGVDVEAVEDAAAFTTRSLPACPLPPPLPPLEPG